MDALTIALQAVGQIKGNGHAMHDVGAMSIVTSPLTGQPGSYLTAVMRDRVPFDAQVSGSMQDAVVAHARFAVAADLYEYGQPVDASLN